MKAVSWRYLKRVIGEKSPLHFTAKKFKLRNIH